MLTVSLYAMALAVGICLYWFLYSGPGRRFMNTGHPLQGIKGGPPDASFVSSAANYFRSHKTARKAQVKEVHHSNDTSTVKVITPDGVTLLEKTDYHPDKPPQLPPKRINKPPAPPPPAHPPCRPPAPLPAPSPPPSQVRPSASGDEDEELKRIHEASAARRLQRASISSSVALSLCSSPDLPLPPPPPANQETNQLDSDEPLPPPPDFPEQTDKKPPLVYPKNSYMSYRNERKPTRQGFDGKYRRMSPTSPVHPSGNYGGNGGTSSGDLSPSSSWEQIHNIRKQAPTLIFHSETMPVKSQAHLPNGLHPIDPDRGAILDHNANNDQQRLVSDPQTSPCPSRVNGNHATPSQTNENVLRGSFDQMTQSGTPVDPMEVSGHHSSANSSSSSPMSCSTPDVFERTPPLGTPTGSSSLGTPPLGTPSATSPVMTHERGVSPSEPIRHQDVVSKSHHHHHLHHSQVHHQSHPHQILQQHPSVPSESSVDLCPVPRINCATQTTDTPRLSRKQVQKTREELDCERLSQDFAVYCQDAMLKSLLVPAPEHKTMSDYMEGLFTVELQKNGQQQITRRSFSPKNGQTTIAPSPPTNGVHKEEQNLPANSAYFTTSEPKAKLLNRFSQDISRQEWSTDRETSRDKKKVKEELIASISRKLELLRLEQVAIKEEVSQNEVLGREVVSRVEQLAKPNELGKYKLHIDEMEKIVNLLMSLSGRLARAQNALMSLPSEISKEERSLLEAKRDKLSAQHEEARYLKESIDRRSYQVSTFLHCYLSDEEFADYDHFIKSKSKLLMDARELDEKIKLGEEQLTALENGCGTQIWHRTHTRTGSTSV